MEILDLGHPQNLHPSKICTYTVVCNFGDATYYMGFSTLWFLALHNVTRTHVQICVVLGLLANKKLVGATYGH